MAVSRYTFFYLLIIYYPLLTIFTPRTLRYITLQYKTLLTYYSIVLTLLAIPYLHYYIMHAILFFISNLLTITYNIYSTYTTLHYTTIQNITYLLQYST